MDVNFSRPYSRRQIRVPMRRASASFSIHLVARKYRRMHSRVSHRRSESTRGVLGLFGAEAVGISVHERTVEKREVYFPYCSALRSAAGAGFAIGRGLMKGVFAGLIEPSRVALLDNADKLLGVGGLLGVDGATGLVATTFPLLGVSGGVAAFSIFSPRCKVSGVVSGPAIDNNRFAGWCKGNEQLNQLNEVFRLE